MGKKKYKKAKLWPDNSSDQNFHIFTDYGSGSCSSFDFDSNVCNSAVGIDNFPDHNANCSNANNVDEIVCTSTEGIDAFPDPNPKLYVSAASTPMESSSTQGTATFSDNVVPEKEIKQQNVPTADDVPITERNGKQFSPYVCANLLSKQYLFRIYNDELYLYSTEKKLYVLLTPPVAGKKDVFTSYMYQLLPHDFQAKLTSSNVKQIYSILINNDAFVPTINNSTIQNFINFKNGLYNICTGEFLESHNPETFVNVQLNANFINSPNITNPRVYHYLENLAGGKGNIPSLLGGIGLSLSNYYKLQKALFIVGQPRNGKSTLIKLIEDFVYPKEHLTALTSHDLANSFAPSKLKTAHLSISKDEPATPWDNRAISYFKQVVGQDSILIQEKCVPHEKIMPFCHLIFISNSMPKFKCKNDTSAIDAIARRMWLIPTGPSIPIEEVDPNLIDHLVAEKDALVSLSIIYAHKFINGELSLPELSEKQKAEIFSCSEVISNKLSDFIDKVIFDTKDSKDYIPISLLTEQFNSFSGNDSLNALAPNAFSRELAKYIGSERIKKRKNVSSLIGYIFKGDEKND